MTRFEQLQARIAADPTLRSRLGSAASYDDFVAGVVGLASKLGFDLSAEEGGDGVRAATASWEGGELTESALDGVAGGLLMPGGALPLAFTGLCGSRGPMGGYTSCYQLSFC